MSVSEENFREHVELSVKTRFGIIALNRVDRSNAFTIKQLRNLKKFLTDSTY
jgi:enoyl-CoA hydratase/carnithine racemase